MNTIEMLFAVIRDRQTDPQPNSYTNRLLDAGEAKIVQKIGEEAVEVIIAAGYEDNDRLVNEMADLTYHCLVLLAARGLSPADIAQELERRHAG
ncbi:MAG: phosphoribosyl-ATP diphosphatase [Chloroflexi bacterium]|nr:phosphoribosyl-ATP diphosphatase [Chloroflexota bacterium]